MVGMDYVDAAIVRCLAKGSRSLVQLMEETAFSRATVFNHLPHLGDAISRELVRAERRGRPSLLYKLIKAPSTLEAQSKPLGAISISFLKLKHACRFEKGGFCKELRKACAPETCPLIARE
jgi:predicted ArsR family transcriptional regulator